MGYVIALSFTNSMIMAIITNTTATIMVCTVTVYIVATSTTTIMIATATSIIANMVISVPASVILGSPSSFLTPFFTRKEVEYRNYLLGGVIYVGCRFCCVL